MKKQCHALAKSDFLLQYFSDKDMAQKIEKGQITVSSKGHGGTEAMNAKEATRTEKGYTSDQVCKSCGTVIAKGKAIAKTEHAYKDGKCTVYGTVDLNNNTSDTTLGNPQTDDDSNVVLWFALLLLAFGSVTSIAIHILQRKRRHQSVFPFLSSLLFINIEFYCYL